MTLDILPDDDNPSTMLSAFDALGTELARVPVPPNFKLDASIASAWIANGFRKPA